MNPTETDVYLLARVVSGQAVNGSLGTASGPFRKTIEYLDGLPLGDRSTAFQAVLAAPGMDGDALVNAMASTDPLGPPPVAATVLRSAHLGDLTTSAAATRFVWPSWIVRGHFNLLSSDPKIGKTHLMLDLAARIWRGDPWPDGQAPTFPANTPTLWICGDRHQDELRERARAFGLPDEAIRLNADPLSPYGGWDLDDGSNVDLMRRLVEGERPALVLIDTVWRATRRQLRREEEANTLLDPIITLAQDTETAILGAMHLSKDGDTLGRRLEGLARSVIKMFRPDPENQPTRRKLTVIGNFKEPPPLGVTLEDAGCSYDFDPPEAPATTGPGRPPVKTDKAVAFLIGKLSQGDAKQCDLVNEWLASGGSKDPIFRAVELMENDGRLVIDATKKPKICHLVSNSP